MEGVVWAREEPVIGMDCPDGRDPHTANIFPYMWKIKTKALPSLIRGFH